MNTIEKSKSFDKRIVDREAEILTLRKYQSAKYSEI